MAWLALDTTETEAVAAALGLHQTRAATWLDGIDAALQGSVFVTPPLADWTLVVSRILFSPDQPETFVTPLLERLSEQFGDAQFFCTMRDIELHGWACARKGRLVRGYGWLGEKKQTLWNEGLPTREERDLGFAFVNPQSALGSAWADDVPTVPDENCVTQLAFLWSVDPTILNEEFKEPVKGVLGTVPGLEPNPWT
jgi:hypothetical protein